MKNRLLIIVLMIVFILFDVIEMKKKKKLKIGKKIKKLFVPKKHHKKPKSASNTLSVPTSSSITPTMTLLVPTETTFSSSFTVSDVLITITDRNYNYFYGYATNVAGVNFYKSPKFLVAGPQQKCGCCDNKIIIVTKAPEERLI